MKYKYISLLLVIFGLAIAFFYYFEIDPIEIVGVNEDITSISERYEINSISDRNEPVSISERYATIQQNQLLLDNANEQLWEIACSYENLTWNGYECE